jgi:carboxyl-terminal processing protease
MIRRTKLASRFVTWGLMLAIASSGCTEQKAAAAPDPRSTDANITRLTTSILEHSQFAHHPFDDELAATLLNRYLDTLDPTRSLFTSIDVEELSRYRTGLAEATRKNGDTHVAQAIFNRFLERLQQRASYVDEMLRRGAFDFTGHDVFVFDRETAPRPADLSTAKSLWRQQLRAEYLEQNLGNKTPEQIVGALTSRYDQQLRTMRAFKPDDVLEVYLNALAHVYDPHSDYLGHEQMEDLNIAMHLSLFGIGATLESTDGHCTIKELVPGGPAARGGLLKPGDRIVAVAQAGQAPVDITDMSLSRAVELIRGPKGSTVMLSVLPAGALQGSAPKVESLVRDEVKLEDQAAKARIVDLPTAAGPTVRLGVIDLPAFYTDSTGHEGETHRSATADVARLLTKLKAEHVHGVVLDLRRNGGGSLDEAISLTGLFIAKGPVVQTRDQAGNVEVGADTDPSIAYDGPLVVLTSRYSASASEILAGALQDYGRALIVGDGSTFGKGTVQNVVPLASVMDHLGLSHAYDPGALKVTIDKFYRPSGASTQLRGVSSDIVLPSISEVSGVSESKLKDPLPYDTIPPASYDRADRVGPYIQTLRQRSAQRVVSESEFALLRGQIARVQKNVSRKSVSLNEAERRQELERAKQEGQTEDARSAVSRPTTYEITLKNVASPGLPAPLIFSPAKSKTVVSSLDLKDDDIKARDDADDIQLEESLKILSDYSLLQNLGSNAEAPK